MPKYFVVLTSSMISLTSCTRSQIPRPSGETASSQCDTKRVLNAFGVTRYTEPWNEGPPHTGIDIVADAGDAVYAQAEGVVVFAYRDKVGTTLTIDYPSLHLSVIYAHIRYTPKRGAKVARGQEIGVVAGPDPSVEQWVTHLHFELGDAEPVDPLSFDYVCPSDSDGATPARLVWPVECRCR